MTKEVNIPVLDLSPQIEALWVPINEAFQRVLRSNHFIMGPEVKAFETEAAEFLGVSHAVGLNSGTDALYIALKALGVGPGDEVITTPFTFFATAEAISHVGAVPVFVDIEEESFNLDPAILDKAITKRTKAILPVHLFGRPCNMEAIVAVAKHHGLPIVEDCAQSFGAAVQGRMTGAIGQLGCFSFFPTKNLNAFGDGGMVVTNDERLANLCRMLRAHGSKRKYYNEMIGYNSRLDEMQAAFLRVKLPYLASWNNQRREAAASYRATLRDLPGIELPQEVEGHVFHQFSIRIKAHNRDQVQKRLADSGIATMVYYPVPSHKLKVYEESHGQIICPVAERVAGQILSLPLWPGISQEVIEQVAEALRAALD